MFASFQWDSSDQSLSTQPRRQFTSEKAVCPDSFRGLPLREVRQFYSKQRRLRFTTTLAVCTTQEIPFLTIFRLSSGFMAEGACQLDRTVMRIPDLSYGSDILEVESLGKMGATCWLSLTVELCPLCFSTD